MFHGVRIKGFHCVYVYVYVSSLIRVFPYMQLPPGMGQIGQGMGQTMGQETGWISPGSHSQNNSPRYSPDPTEMTGGVGYPVNSMGMVSGGKRGRGEGGRERGGREGRREGGREGGREREREGGRKGKWRQGGRKGGWEGGREGGWEGGREGGRVGGRVGGREGGCLRRRDSVCVLSWIHPWRRYVYSVHSNYLLHYRTICGRASLAYCIMTLNTYFN